MLQISLGSVKGRHIMPVTEYIIENEIEDVTDVFNYWKKWLMIISKLKLQTMKKKLKLFFI